MQPQIQTYSGNGEQQTYKAPAGFTVTAVRVNGEPAPFTRPLSYEAVLESAPPLGASVEVEYTRDGPPGARVVDGVQRIWAITPSDKEDLKATPRAIFATTKGTIAGLIVGDQPYTVEVNAGEVVQHVRFNRITKKGTTATGLVAMV